MAVAFTAFTFDQSAENGGEGVKLGFYRVQGARVAKKNVKKSRRDKNGNIKYDGEIVRQKGDAYLFDCNVYNKGAYRGKVGVLPSLSVAFKSILPVRVCIIRPPRRKHLEAYVRTVYCPCCSRASSLQKHKHSI
jgi:hypothetical protein